MKSDSESMADKLSEELILWYRKVLQTWGGVMPDGIRAEMVEHIDALTDTVDEIEDRLENPELYIE